MKSLQGYLLVSAPELPDVFHSAVVLLVRHNEEGALGLILNRPTETHVAEIWDKVSDSECRVKAPLYMGGPVDGPLMCLHGYELLLEMEVLPGIYFSANRDKLEQIAVKTDQFVRFFVGYAGWAAGQLEEELKRGSWAVLPANVSHVFQSDESLWNILRREIADEHLRSALGIKHAPRDVTMN